VVLLAASQHVSKGVQLCAAANQATVAGYGMPINNMCQAMVVRCLE